MRMVGRQLVKTGRRTIDRAVYRGNIWVTTPRRDMLKKKYY